METQTVNTDNYTLVRSGDVVVVFSRAIDAGIGPDGLMVGVVNLADSTTTLRGDDHRRLRDELHDHLVDTSDAALVGSVLGVLGSGSFDVTSVSVRQVLRVTSGDSVYAVRVASSDDYEELMVTSHSEHVASAYADAGTPVSKIAVSRTFPEGVLEVVAASDVIEPRCANFVRDVMRRIEMA